MYNDKKNIYILYLVAKVEIQYQMSSFNWLKCCVDLHKVGNLTTCEYLQQKIFIQHKEKKKKNFKQDDLEILTTALAQPTLQWSSIQDI